MQRPFLLTPLYASDLHFFFLNLSSSRTLSGTKISSIPAELCKDLKLLRTLSVFLLYVHLYNPFCRKDPQTNDL